MKKLVGAKRYVEKEFSSLADIAHSVGFDAGTPANRVAEYLEEYAARTHGVTLIYAQETAEDLLRKLADARVLQEEWFRYNRSGGDPLRLRECVIDIFDYAEILDHEGKIYGVRFPNSCLVATAHYEPDLYERGRSRNHVAKIRTPCLLAALCIPRPYYMAHSARRCSGSRDLSPLC